MGVGVIAGLATVGLSIGSAADATVTVGAINCSSSTILGPVAIRNPSVSHVTGPLWAAQGSPATITNVAGLTVLPSAVGPATIGSYQDLVNKSQLVGQLTTTVATGAIPGLVFNYDPDLSDNGGVPNPVPMNGVATYGALGPFAAPTVVINAPLPLVGTAGTYEVVTSLDPGAGNLPVQGSIGGGIFSPNVPMSITNVGTTDGPVSIIATSTTLTANVTAPIATSAVTSCAPSANPTHTIQVQTDGGPIVASAPVIACDPANNTTGLFKDSKGWWSQDTVVSTPENVGGSLGGATTYTGCVAPDQRLNAWNLSKNGAPAVEAVALAKAEIAIKTKSFGDCTMVDKITSAGQAHAANSPDAYQGQGVLSTKYLTAANATSKVKGSTVYGTIDLVIDTSGGGLPVMRFDFNGLVTKGAGLGGAASWVAEVDTSVGQNSAAGIIGCNTAGYTPPAIGKFFGNTAPYLNLKTGDDAQLIISAP